MVIVAAVVELVVVAVVEVVVVVGICAVDGAAVVISV